MRTVAILPVKTFGRAKQRLTGGFGDRPGLAAAMVADVLDALAAVPELDELIMVTAQAVSADTDFLIVHDPVEAGQSAAAARGIEAALERGAERVLLVPGDCPALDPREVDELVAGAMSAPDVVIVPDRHGTGTNALLLAPPDAIAPSFGPGSRERHENAAEASGARWRLAEPRSLVLDVDTAEDLAALRVVLDSRTGGAAHTRGLLARLDRQ